MSGVVKKGAEKIVKTALKTPRAVTAAEAPFIEPAKESTKETMMPWTHWFDRFLDKNLGSERYQALRSLVLYRPDDLHNMHQIPNPMTKVPLTKDGTNGPYRQFRHPSPGSESDPVRIPDADPGTPGDDPYNVLTYSRDTARRYLNASNPHADVQELKLAMMDQDDPEVKEMLEKIRNPGSSPGNKGTFATGPTDFDDTGGLRASMSTNHEAMEKELDANMPDHLPTPNWWNDQEEVAQWYLDRDLPVPMGRVEWGNVPTFRRVARW